MTGTLTTEAMRGQIDFVIITIRQDEFTAVLKRFTPSTPMYGPGQIYEYCELQKTGGQTVKVAIARAIGQGHAISQSVATRAILELAPRWIIVAGIAGGVVDRDYTLGDVLLATNIYDLSVTAASEGKPTAFRPRGGSVHRSVARLLENLPAWRNRLGDWNTPAGVGCEKPTLVVPDDTSDDDFYYGSEEFRKDVSQILAVHFPRAGGVRPPLFLDAPLASASILVKDTEIVNRWREVARDIAHVEMEAGGIYLAASEALPHPIPFLSVRGISDLIGVVRKHEWTPYACDSAASFLHALLTLQPNEAFGFDSARAVPATTSEIEDAAIGNTSAPTIEQIYEAFAKSSEPLISMVVLEDSRIDRPEIKDIKAEFSTESGKVLCVLGSPGSGKTALLALVAQDAAKEQIPTLALKADLLPPDEPFTSWGSRELGVDLSAIDAVRLTASRGKVLVLVDQLDALGSIVAISSDLFNLVLNFLRDCAAIPNVSVVCSCRSLDFYQDARFAPLNAKTVELALPPWDTVAEYLRNRGIEDAERWPVEFREVLRTPQHLRVFLDCYADTGRANIVASYQLMLDAVWTHSVVSPAERSFLDSLTIYLMATESLWAPIAAFENDTPAITTLKVKGIVDSQGLKIGFKHQTLLEHSKARLFTKTDQSFSEYVLGHQTALQVRPTVWSVLDYLRNARPEKYEVEVERLFNTSLRLHLRYLLIEYLGQQSIPSEFEQALMAARLADDSDRIRALLSIIGKREWFHALRGSHLPTVMRGESKYQWPMVGVLKSAWDYDHDACFTLIKENWFFDPTKDQFTHRVLSETDKWDERELQMAGALIRRTTDQGDRLFWAEQLVYTVSASRPDMAPRLFVDAISKLLEQPGERNPIEWSKGWYELPAVAEAAPIEFLRAAWGWFVMTCEASYPDPQSSVLFRYGGYSTSMEDRHYRRDSPVLQAFIAAVDQAVAANPAEFVAITRPSWESENGTVHRLLMRGLKVIGAIFPAVGLEYLSGDRRRLQVGSSRSDRRSDSKTLIAVLSAHLSESELRTLERLIIRWTQYRDGQTLSEEQVRWDREDRLHLLTAVPTHLLSTHLVQLVENEKAAFPNWNRVAPESKSGTVHEVAPITKSEMVDAAEDKIVAVISQTPEIPYGERERIEVAGGWEMPGGPRAAGRELSELVKDDPHKVVRIVTQLVAKGSEKAASAPIQRLADSTLTTGEVVAFVRALIALDPQSNELRHEISYMLYRRSVEHTGTLDDLCAAVSEWLNDAAPQGQDSDHTAENEEFSNDGDSVLWGSAGSVALRSIHYPFWLFLAVTQGYLRRTPPATAKWLDVIERALTSNFSEFTWVRYCSQLTCVRNLGDDQARGVAVVVKLLGKFPNLIRRAEGLHLIANISDLLTEAQLRQVLDRLRTDHEAVLRQAYGELLTLVAFRDGEHGWARNVLDAELVAVARPENVDDSIAVGIAHAAANLWDEPRARADSATVLSRLIPTSNKRIGHAIAAVFWARQDFAADDYTDTLLRTLASNASKLPHIPIRDLVGHLVTLAPFKKELVLSLCDSIVESRGVESELFEVGPQLVKISMTLQRFADTRNGALDFFEELLRLGLDSAFQVLSEIDIRPHASTAPVRRERRRRRRRPASDD
jgi:nucleoside phosphorylase